MKSSGLKPRGLPKSAPRRGGHRARRPAVDAPREPLQPLLVDPLTGRTGSTMMMAILSTSPGIAFDRVYPYESRYVTYLCRFAGQVWGTDTAPQDWNMTQLLEGAPYVIGPLPFTPLSV